jgi:hypothetical protein
MTSTSYRGVRPAGILICLLVMACGSSPRITVDGVWMRGGVSGDHSGLYFVELQQAGDEITGSACYLQADHLIFRGAPVRSEYPEVTFVVTAESLQPGEPPTLIGGRFSGRVRDANTIAGQIQYGGTPAEMILTRTSDSVPGSCAP